MNWLLPKELPIEITDHVLCLSFEWDWYNFFTKPSIGIQYFVVHCFRRAQLLPLSWVELHAIERQTVISATSVIFMQPPNHLSSEPLCRRHITEIILHASPLQSNGGRTQKIWFKFLAKCYRTTLCASVARHWVWATSLKIFVAFIPAHRQMWQSGLVWYWKDWWLKSGNPKKQSTLPLLSSNWMSTFSLCHCLSMQQIKTGN